MLPIPSVRTLALASLGLAVSGCKKFDDLGDGYAMGFDGRTSCGTAPGDWSLVGDSFTAEAWVRAGDDLDYEVHPLMVWQGAFALWSDPDGIGWFSTTEVDPQGVSTPIGWMDGELHHVAGTYEDGFAALYVDGDQVGFSTSVELGAEALTDLQVGCWEGKDSHDGIIDEVRLSAGVRYTADFSVLKEPFVGDDRTVYLFHANEGAENVALDAMGRADLTLEAVTWEPFVLGGGGAGEE